MTFDLSVMKIFIHHNKLFLLRDTQHNDHIYIECQIKNWQGLTPCVRFFIHQRDSFFFFKTKKHTKILPSHLPHYKLRSTFSNARMKQITHCFNVELFEADS